MRDPIEVLRRMVRDRVDDVCVNILKNSKNFNEILSTQGAVDGLEWVLDRIEELTTED